MAAHFIPIGEPAHDAERQALRFLVDGLPDSFTVYGNPWLVERTGVIYELDAVVVAPHAVFVVEIKSHRGRIEGTDNDWWLPEKVRSPLKLNRTTAQVLKSHLKKASYQAGQVWTEGLVFLSATTDVGVRGPASNDRVHTKKSILAALQDEALIRRLSGGRALTPSEAADRYLLELFKGMQSGPRPVRRVREYEVIETLDHHDTYTELLGKNSLSGAERLLRIYSIPPFATQAQRDRIAERARWEAQVLGRLGRSEGVLTAEQPFADESGIVLPLEHFKGITLTTWVERHGVDGRGKEKADLRARTDLWIRIAQAIDEVHRQGVVHRLLRPDVVLVEDNAEPKEVRVTGFDLAKQMSSDATIALSTVHDDRLSCAAPEVVSAFSSAEPASDQFSLGAMLALLLTGKPLFENTRQLMAARRLMRRVRDISPRLPISLDEAVSKMVELRATDRYSSLADAIGAVRTGREPTPRTINLATPTATRAPIDADNLQAGTLVGSDYEIVSRLGQGGMAVVYAARHLVSGRVRALKIAVSNDVAEEALRGEYKVLASLDHPNIVRVIDLTKMVEGRLTLVMERVSGVNLRQWLMQNTAPAPTTQRRLAEDLIAGLDYLERNAVTHKDLKPDNLLVSDGRLTIIDFSLASTPEDAPYGGTALYRDPASARWTHATDRFAAALCLFEIYAGRHAFDGRVPEPGQAPIVADDDIQPSGLAAFFRKALHPAPEQRFPSAQAMRDALLVALGEDAPVPVAVDPAMQIDERTPLRASGLSVRAINALARCQVHSVGQLLCLTASQVRAIHAIGTKTSNDIISFQEMLLQRGLQPQQSPAALEPQLLPELSDSPEPVQKLALGESMRSALAAAGLPTVGAVASATRSALLALPGVGRKKLAEVVEALYQFRASTEWTTPSDDGGHTLDRIWELATRPLTAEQRTAIERFIGITGEPETQEKIADDLRTNQPRISQDVSKGLERLDLSALADLVSAFDAVVDGFGGIVRLDEIGERFESEWPAGMVTGHGIVRLLVRVTPGRAQIFDVDGVDEPVLARPLFDRETVRAFAAEVVRLAGQWPPVEPDTARRTLAGLLPHFDGDPFALGVRLCDDVELAETGHLFIGPVDPKHSIGFVIEQAREAIELDELGSLVRRVFGQNTPYPDPDHLLAILRDLDCRVEGSRVLPRRAGSIVASAPLTADELPSTLGTGPVGMGRSPEMIVRDMLKEAAGSRGFRMLVTPPEAHGEIGRSVAAALGARWVSFDDAFFNEHATDIKSLERAERFVAQREALTDAAEATLFNLLEEHGRPGNVVVLGDTALFKLCEALDLPRRLYDETLSGSRGFWVLVVPGVIHNRQPRFNEGPAMWHLEGATLPLLNPLPETTT